MPHIVVTHRIRGLLVAAGGVIAAQSCGQFLEVCAGVGEPGIIAEVRTSAGAPAALGATLIAVDGSFADTTGPIMDHVGGDGDSLRIYGAWNRGGLYQVRVTKPYWTQVARVVRVPGDRCGNVEPQQIQLTMDLLPNAPAVRSVGVHPRFVRFGFCGSGAQLIYYVDANAGVSTGVRWTSSDTTVARVSSSGLVSNRSRGLATIRATSLADSTIFGTASVQVDPVCP